MGTYRTNKIHVKEAYLIEGFEYCPLKGGTILVSVTDKMEFEAPLYPDFIWRLGEITTETSDGYRCYQNFNCPLYKVVCREGRAYLLIMQLLDDSVVYEGASSGKGLYFETDINIALNYYVLRNSNRVWEAPVYITADTLNTAEQETKDVTVAG